MDMHNPSSYRSRLDAVNFFLADVRDGLGPYLAIYLLAIKGPQQGWNEATIGYVATFAGICGLLTLTPAGILIDRLRTKRLIVIAASLVVTFCCLLLPFISSFSAVAVTQALASMAASFFAPAIAGISLGVVGPRYFTRRIGRNEAFNHAGNVFAAVIAAIGSYFLGPVLVFWLMAVLTVLSILVIAKIPARAINVQAMQGMAESGQSPVRLKMLLTSRVVLIFAGLMALFHLSNAAMLPILGQLLSRLVGAEHATSMVAICIVAAQLVMVPVSLFVTAKTDLWGRKPFILLAFAFLCLRGFLYPLFDNPFWLVSIQLLDGVGAGILGALFPIVVSDMTWGKGHFNAVQGAVSMVQSIGAALSATFAGLMIIGYGYQLTFVSLALIALVGLIIAILCLPETLR